MRRLACTVCVAAALVAPTSAHAHTLAIGLAVAKARAYAAALAPETWPSQQVVWHVTGCARANRYAVNCTFFMAGGALGRPHFRARRAVLAARVVRYTKRMARCHLASRKPMAPTAVSYTSQVRRTA